jgi:S1-C subfamily serine protease
MKRLGLILLLGGGAFAGGVVGVMGLGLTRSIVVAQPPPDNLPLRTTPGAPSSAPAPPPPAAEATFRGLPASDDTLVQLSNRFEAVVRKVGPAVISVEAVKPPSAQAVANGKSKPVEESGSGVIVNLDGFRGPFALTNNHVISGARPDQITCHMADGRVIKPSRVWTDPESDIAVMQLDAEGLPTALLGDSERARVGQWVLALGSPFGLDQSVTHGIISARERGQVSLGSTIRIKDFLQTDAAINPGSSGGPLVNLDGEVVAINTAIASQSGSNSGVAFSIPVNLVKRVSRQLLEKGSVARGYLGVQLALVMEPADALRLGMERVQGALVEKVYPETPAATAGLRPNDVVLQLDGAAIRNENHLINLVSTLPAGQRVRLQVWRDRRNETVEVVVGDWNRAQGKLRGSAQ